jgi:hypothetical protein
MIVRMGVLDAIWNYGSDFGTQIWKWATALPNLFSPAQGTGSMSVTPVPATPNRPSPTLGQGIANMFYGAGSNLISKATQDLLITALVCYGGYLVLKNPKVRRSLK